MATLRNKTTEDGSIVRWLPHPDHTRPSTYQITHGAVRLLGKMGYSVSSPGDEIEIPRDVCRPLRILGDLYFKSERPGEAELDGVSKVTKQSTESLSGEQQDLLWSYIESHSQYDGQAQELLSDGTAASASRKEDEQTSKSQDNGHRIGTSNSQTPGIIPSRDVHIGRISRFSNANNAMFEPRGDSELNMGSLPKSTEGQMTIGVQYATNFALCLTPQLWTSSYRNTVRKNLDELISRTNLGGLNDLFKIEDRASPRELSKSDVSVYLTVIGEGFGIGFRGPWTIVVLSDHLSGQRSIRVEIVDDYKDILLARPIPIGEDSEPISVGSDIDISVDQVDDEVIRGSFGPRLIEVPRTSSNHNRSFRAAITEIDSEHIVASVSALDESSRPTVGEHVTLENGSFNKYPSIPVITPPSLPETDAPLSLIVDEIETDGVRASVSNTRSSLSVGQALSLKIDTWNQGIGTTVVEGIPLRVENSRPLPEVPIRVKIAEFTQGYVRCRFIKADVPFDDADDIETLLESGDQFLQDEDYTNAMTVFSTAVEISRRENSPVYEQARVGEILAICESLQNRDGSMTGIDLLDVIESDAEGLAESNASQLTAYRCILKADSLITDGESAEGTTATALRRDAKQMLEEGVDHLASIEDSNPAIPHPAITTKLEDTTDRLLIPPNPVSTYLDSSHNT